MIMCMTVSIYYCQIDLKKIRMKYWLGIKKIKQENMLYFILCLSAWWTLTLLFYDTVFRHVLCFVVAKLHHPANKANHSYTHTHPHREGEKALETKTVLMTIIYCYIYWRTLVWQLAPSPHSRRVPGLNPGWGLSVWSWHVLQVYAWVLSGYSGFLTLPEKHACQVNRWL